MVLIVLWRTLKKIVFQEKKQGGVQITSLNKQQLELNDNEHLEVEPVEDEAKVGKRKNQKHFFFSSKLNFNVMVNSSFQV